jgi:hypothetical protein
MPAKRSINVKSGDFEGGNGMSSIANGNNA